MFTYMHTNGIRAELHSEGATITPTSLYDPVVRINLEEFSAIRAAILDNLGFWRGENTGCLVVAKPNPNNQHLFVDPARPTCGWVNREALGRYLDVVPPALPYLEPGEVWRIRVADGSSEVAVVDSNNGSMYSPSRNRVVSEYKLLERLFDVEGNPT